MPEPATARLRDLTRYRHQKLLETAGIKLDSVATDVVGKSSRRMLEAMIAGERNPDVLAETPAGRGGRLGTHAGECHLDFSACITASRTSRPLSKPSRSTGMAPPWTRRSRPWRSRVVRSRRMVSAVTSSSVASSATSTRPSRRARSTICWCRSSAYMCPLSPYNLCFLLYIPVSVGCRGRDTGRVSRFRTRSDPSAASSRGAPKRSVVGVPP